MGSFFMGSGTLVSSVLSSKIRGVDVYMGVSVAFNKKIQKTIDPVKTEKQRRGKGEVLVID